MATDDDDDDDDDDVFPASCHMSRPCSVFRFQISDFTFQGSGELEEDGRGNRGVRVPLPEY